MALEIVIVKLVGECLIGTWTHFPNTLFRETATSRLDKDNFLTLCTKEFKHLAAFMTSGSKQVREDGFLLTSLVDSNSDTIAAGEASARQNLRMEPKNSPVDVRTMQTELSRRLEDLQEIYTT